MVPTLLLLVWQHLQPAGLAVVGQPWEGGTKAELWDGLGAAVAECGSGL